MFPRRCCMSCCRGSRAARRRKSMQSECSAPCSRCNCLPLLLGLTVKHRRPQFANRLLRPLEIVSNALNLSVAGLILGTQFRMLTDIPIAGFAGMLILLAASLVIGWLAGGAARALSASITRAGIW